MSTDLMFVLEKAQTDEMGICASGATWPHHPNLQAAVEAADHDGLIVTNVPDIPYRPHRWEITEAGRARLDVLWKANGRHGFDAPDTVFGACCGRRWTFPGDTVDCSRCATW